MCLHRCVLHIEKRLLHTDRSPFLCLFTDTMTMTMERLTSYWIVALKSISRLLSALLKRLPKGCMIASGGSSSTLRRFVLMLAGLPCNSQCLLTLLHIVEWLSNPCIISRAWRTSFQNVCLGNPLREVYIMRSTRIDKKAVDCPQKTGIAVST